MELKFKHFIFLNVLDIILTWYALTYMGLHEGNPILSPLFVKVGLLWGLVTVKLIGIMMICMLINTMAVDIQKIAIYLICGMFTVVILNNMYWMIV